MCTSIDFPPYAAPTPRPVRVEVRTYLNDGEGRFSEYQSGDRLYPGPVVTIDLDPGERSHPLLGRVARSQAGFEYTALDRAWSIGNRQEPDSLDVSWPSYVRSLSMGDVLAIGELAWSVATFGFTLLTTDDLVRSLGQDAVDNSRGTFGPPATSRAEAGLR